MRANQQAVHSAAKAIAALECQLAAAKAGHEQAEFDRTVALAEYEVELEAEGMMAQAWPTVAESLRMPDCVGRSSTCVDIEDLAKEIEQGRDDG